MTRWICPVCGAVVRRESEIRITFCVRCGVWCREVATPVRAPAPAPARGIIVVDVSEDDIIELIDGSELN